MPGNRKSSPMSKVSSAGPIRFHSHRIGPRTGTSVVNRRHFGRLPYDGDRQETRERERLGPAVIAIIGRVSVAIWVAYYYGSIGTHCEMAFHQRQAYSPDEEVHP